MNRSAGITNVVMFTCYPCNTAASSAPQPLLNIAGTSPPSSQGLMPACQQCSCCSCSPTAAWHQWIASAATRQYCLGRRGGMWGMPSPRAGRGLQQPLRQTQAQTCASCRWDWCAGGGGSGFGCYGFWVFVQGTGMTVMLVYCLAVQAAGIFRVCCSVSPVFASASTSSYAFPCKSSQLSQTLHASALRVHP
jgi:hypothetical protein